MEKDNKEHSGGCKQRDVCAGRYPGRHPIAGNYQPVSSLFKRSQLPAGADYLFMLLEKILGWHVPIAMENPAYKHAFIVFQSFTCEIEEVPIDEYGINVEKLRATKARVAYVMPSHQYPTGVVMQA